MMTERFIEGKEWRWVFIVSALLLVTISIPFVWAYGAAAPDRYFMGILVNPIDGASYIAKMRQGIAGSWLFHLPYTPEPHRGVYLLTFYLGLGHLARLLNLSPVLVFHAARLVGSLVMFIFLYRFVADWTDDIVQRRLSWGLAVLGSGFGWISLLVRILTPSLQVEHLTPDLLGIPEAFPILAAYTNAHFPWAIALAVWAAHALATAVLVETKRWPTLSNARATGLALSVLFLVGAAPFVLVPLSVGFFAMFSWLWWRRRVFPGREAAWGLIIPIFALPQSIYTLWAISGSNPIIHAWMQQNVTPSPSIWDYLIAYGPLLILVVLAVWASRRMLQGGDIFLLGWLCSGAVLLYLPLSLQRRFSIALIVPLAVYAGRGLWRVLVPLFASRWQWVIIVLVFSLFVPTVVVSIVLPLAGTLSPGEAYFYYISRDESQALDWIDTYVGPDEVVLASPEMGLFIPTRGPRVVYGHPFETINAQERRAEVLDFFAGVDCGVIDREGVDYVLVGPREQALAGDGTICPLPDFEVFKTSGGKVVIYATGGE